MLLAGIAGLASCSQAGGPTVLPPQQNASQTACYVTKIDPTKVQATITFYGWPDNAPPGNKIAHPILHKHAGGDGTYCNPTTFATERANNKAKLWYAEHERCHEGSRAQPHRLGWPLG